MTYIGARNAKRTWTVHFVARIDTPFAAAEVWRHERHRGATLSFAARPGQQVQARVALSYRSLEQARGYLASETPDWNFEKAHASARREWSEAPNRIEVEGGTPSQRPQFYTALYRAHVTPNDWTGEAPARYGQRRYYENILCMWDTFRTVNPLLTLIQPQEQSAIVNTILD